MATFKTKSGKTWVSPLKNAKNKIIKNIKNMHAKNITHLFQKLRFRAMSSKTWTWVPIQEDHARTNTKTWFLFQLSDQNETFLQKLKNTIFISRINFKSMHAVQNKINHAM